MTMEHSDDYNLLLVNTVLISYLKQIYELTNN
jgi:hypothetical protein